MNTSLEYTPLVYKDDTVIGIVGGMGPEAGVNLVGAIHKHTKAVKDQDHLSTILMSFPKHIEDRTAFIKGNIVSNPGYEVAKIIEKLENAGATLIGIACNSSHSPVIYNVILDELDKRQSQVKILNMPFETCKHIKNHHPNISRVGVISTNGTYISGIYDKILEEMGFEVIKPEYDFQNEVIHEIVYNVDYGLKSKSDEISQQINGLMQKALDFFKNNKADAVILGCTELALIPKNFYKTDLSLFDSNELFAIALIEQAKVIERMTRPIK